MSKSNNSKYPTSPSISRAASPTSSIASSYSSRLSFSNSSLPSPVNSRQGCMSAAAKRYRYLRRLFKFRQMDFQFAAWQMFYLFINPRKVFRNFQYRKQTKAQFARDDPAFVVLLCVWLCVTCVCLSVVLGLGIWGFVHLLLYTVFVDTLIAGAVVATILWFVTNRYMIRSTCLDQDVEWAYAFDVHLNAFFPALLLLHFVQVILYPAFLSQPWLVSRLVGNLLWVIAIAYYIFITFLGYNALNILEGTRRFLYALPALAALYLVSLLSGTNLSQSLVYFYHYRVL